MEDDRAETGGPLSPADVQEVDFIIAVTAGPTVTKLALVQLAQALDGVMEGWQFGTWRSLVEIHQLTEVLRVQLVKVESDAGTDLDERATSTNRDNQGAEGSPPATRRAASLKLGSRSIK
jgi:hypothetical protein